MSKMAMYQWIGSAAAVLALSCAAQQPRPEHSATTTETVPDVESAPAVPQCVDDKDQAVECLSDSDCCQGFVCSKDPERSQRVSYCMYGGGG